MHATEKHYTLIYTDKSIDHIILITNDTETHILSDGFNGYATVLKCSNTIKQVCSFLKRGKYIKNIKLDKTIIASKRVLKKGKLVNITTGSFPKKSGDWFSK